MLWQGKNKIQANPEYWKQDARHRSSGNHCIGSKSKRRPRTHRRSQRIAKLGTERNMSKIIVENTEITVLNIDNRDYICLTDMAGEPSENLQKSTCSITWNK